MLAIRAGQLIDGTGGEPVRGAVVLVDGERIVKVGAAREVEVPPEAKELDASDKTVMPGMIDAHVHVQSMGGPPSEYQYGLERVSRSQGFLALRAYHNVRRDLDMGFTAVRTLSSPWYVDVALRDAINQDLVVGPRVRACGQGLTITGGHMDGGRLAPEVSISGRTGVCDGPWECRKATREQLKRGADVIKVNAAVSLYSLDYSVNKPYHQEMTYEEMAAICEEAHWAGKRVAAHAHGGQGITDGVRAGLNSIEHAPWITDEQLEMMAERGVFYVPTLITHTRGLSFGKEGFKAMMGSRYEAAWNWLLKVEEGRWDTLERAKKIGVKIATGTDAGFWVRHGENAGELEDLVRGGFTPMEAIVAATRTGAECLDLDRDVGTIEAGKYADLVIVDGNPLVDVRILQDKDKIVQVLKGGQQVK